LHQTIGLGLDEEAVLWSNQGTIRSRNSSRPNTKTRPLRGFGAQGRNLAYVFFALGMPRKRPACAPKLRRRRHANVSTRPPTEHLLTVMRKGCRICDLEAVSKLLARHPTRRAAPWPPLDRAGVEAHGEPAVDRSEKLAGLVALALTATEPRHARRAVQLHLASRRALEYACAFAAFGPGSSSAISPATR
jgi:hypothetical protein